MWSGCAVSGRPALYAPDINRVSPAGVDSLADCVQRYAAVPARGSAQALADQFTVHPHPSGNSENIVNGKSGTVNLRPYFCRKRQKGQLFVDISGVV